MRGSWGWAPRMTMHARSRYVKGSSSVRLSWMIWENSRHWNRPPGRELNPEPAKYETAFLSTHTYIQRYQYQLQRDALGLQEKLNYTIRSSISWYKFIHKDFSLLILTFFYQKIKKSDVRHVTETVSAKIRLSLYSVLLRWIESILLLVGATLRASSYTLMKRDGPLFVMYT